MPTLIFCALPNDTQPRYLANAASSAVTPISPAAKKFHLFILCSTFDNSPWSILSAPGFRVGGRQIADMNRQRPLYCRPNYLWACPFSTHDGFGDVCYVPKANISVVISDV